MAASPSGKSNEINSTPTTSTSKLVSSVTFEKFYSEFCDFKNELWHRLETFNSRVDSIESTISTIVTENKKLKSEICDLKKCLNSVEKNQIQNSIDIVGVPFVKDENIFETVHKICFDGVGVDISIDDIDNCFRKSMKRDDKRNGIISVRFTHKLKKEKVMSAVRSKHNNKTKTFISSSIIDIKSNGKIF